MSELKLKTTAEWRAIAGQKHYINEQVPFHNLLVALEDIETLLSEVDALVKQNEKYREALTWYADEQNYYWASGREPIICDDEGQRAREALEGK